METALPPVASSKDFLSILDLSHGDLVSLLVWAMVVLIFFSICYVIVQNLPLPPVARTVVILLGLLILFLIVVDFLLGRGSTVIVR